MQLDMSRSMHPAGKPPPYIFSVQMQHKIYDRYGTLSKSINIFKKLFPNRSSSSFSSPPLHRGKIPEYEDGLDLDALAVPGVGENDPAVGVGRQEYTEKLAQQLLPEHTTTVSTS
jgi:hypothetical protein